MAEIRKWIDRTIRVAGIAAIISGGAFLYQQNQQLGAENRELKAEIDYMADELYQTDEIGCMTADFINQATGGPGVDCDAAMASERGRFAQHGIVLPKPTPNLPTN